MTHQLKLVSFDICPYVERSRIVLLEKGLPHQLELIQLSDKPAWFLEVSPMGRVPVLLVDGRPVFESMVINELVNELQPDPPLFPHDPVARAEGRGWIVFANDVLMPAGGAAMLAIAGGATGDALARALGPVRGALDKLERALGGGPFFLGRDFSLVDAAYAPFFRRWRLAERWGGEGARVLGSFPRVSAWVEAMLARRSVASAEPEDLDAKSRRFYAERAARHAAGRYVAMNHFRVAADRCEEFERGWRERPTYLHDVAGFESFHLLKGPEEDGARSYASHTVWRDEAAFRAWTESEAFQKAHRHGRSTAGTVLGPPRFVGWQAVV